MSVVKNKKISKSTILNIIIAIVVYAAVMALTLPAKRKEITSADISSATY